MTSFGKDLDVKNHAYIHSYLYTKKHFFCVWALVVFIIPFILAAWMKDVNTDRHCNKLFTPHGTIIGNKVLYIHFYKWKNEPIPKKRYYIDSRFIRLSYIWRKIMWRNLFSIVIYSRCLCIIKVFPDIGRKDLIVTRLIIIIIFLFVCHFFP